VSVLAFDFVKKVSIHVIPSLSLSFILLKRDVGLLS
jgi:hypothetical protein